MEWVSKRKKQWTIVERGEDGDSKKKRIGDNCNTIKPLIEYLLVRIIYILFRNYHTNLMISVCLGLAIIFDQVKMKLKALKQD